MATHSSFLSWRIPETGKPGGLPSMGLHRVGHDWWRLSSSSSSIGKGQISQDGVVRLSCPVASRSCPLFYKWLCDSCFREQLAHSAEYMLGCLGTELAWFGYTYQLALTGVNTGYASSHWFWCSAGKTPLLSACPKQCTLAKRPWISPLVATDVLCLPMFAV